MIWPPKKRKHARELLNDSAPAAPQQQQQQQAGPGITSSNNINDDVEVAPATKRVCRYCNREFSSGRALGGHIRVHYRNELQQREEEKATLIPCRKRKDLRSCCKKDVGEERFSNEFVSNLTQALSGCGWKVHKKRGTHKK